MTMDGGTLARTLMTTAAIIFFIWFINSVHREAKAEGIAESADEAIKPESEQSADWKLAKLKAQHRAEIKEQESKG